MKKNLYLLLGAAVILIGAIAVVKMKPNTPAEPKTAPVESAEPTPAVVAPTVEPVASAATTTEPSEPTPPTTADTKTEPIQVDLDATVSLTATVREFTMQSFVEFVDDKPMPQYSLKELTVKKGEKVRLKVTNTKGMHDFNIDELNIHQPTPLNQEVVVEFTADKTGEFVYYCNLPGHRQAGHWGTLKVTE